MPELTPVRDGRRQFLLGQRVIITLLRDPVARFLAIGAAIFGLYWAVGGDSPRPASTITIAEDEQFRMIAAWQANWGRPPNRAEFDELMQRRVREEVLAREARRLGLGDDPTVRAHLADKLQQTFADVADTQTPSPEQLERYYQRHAHRYIEPAELTVEHRFFGRANQVGSEADERRAELALRALRAGDEVIGDAAEVAAYVTVQNPSRIQMYFGEAVYLAVQDAVAKRGDGWLGPFRGRDGWHILRIDSHSVSRQLPLEAVRERVVDAWRREAIDTANERRLQAVLDRHPAVLTPAPAVEPLLGDD